jgi:hypothetical protein
MMAWSVLLCKVLSLAFAFLSSSRAWKSSRGAAIEKQRQQLRSVGIHSNLGIGIVAFTFLYTG